MSGYNPFSDMGYDGGSMNNMNAGAGQGSHSITGQSLDDIVNQNANYIRRQSMPVTYRHRNQNQMDGMTGISVMSDMNGMENMGNMGDIGDMGDMSNLGGMGNMMEFSSGTLVGPLNDFNFDPATTLSHDESGNIVPQGQHPGRPQVKKRASVQNMSSTGSPFSGVMSTAYGNMMDTRSSYQSPAAGNNIEMGMNNSFMNQSMGIQMDSHLTPMQGNGSQRMNAFDNSGSYGNSGVNSPANMNTLSGSIRQDSVGSGMDGRHSHHASLASRRHSMDSQTGQPRMQNARLIPHHSQSGRAQQQQQQHQHQRSNSQSNFAAQPQHPVPGSEQDKGMHNVVRPGVPEGFNPSKHNANNQGFAWETPDGVWPSSMIGKPHMQSAYKNAYSSTGFDMLGVLMRVATRPNPEISLGSVDLSCAFVVCDAEKDDFPIIYCSENFERLTGYTRHMILGRNCRFLQSPDGKVSPGIRRKYVDDDSVLYLKNMINARREAQISLINYRRGGQPFMNLLTMIPISWDTDQVKFFVGFQVDLVEQPNAVTSKNPDGSYTVNYQRGMTMPRYVMNAPESSNKAEFGQTIPRDDVSAILATVGTGESEYAKRMWDKVLLENTDDVVHVLSLKGLFQWVSPSALRVLEYEPGELVGTALSSVCHPSDIVPVTRELKDTSSGASVNVVFRIRRKISGYMWFEGHGSLHTEQGKGRKSIILVGRERPVYTLSKSALDADGGVGEYELWTKMSTSGMFLFVSSNVRQLLDRQPEELVGVSIQSLMRSDSKQDFGRILEHARTGKKASVKHEVINRRGQVLQAFTTLYPGDATEGQKPTFIIAQTKLIKYSRNNNFKPPTLKHERSSNDSSVAGQSTPGQQLSSHDGHSVATSRYITTEASTATYAGQNGLPLGRQDESLASDDNLFDELKTTKSSSWQYEIRQLEKRNRLLAEEVQSLLSAKKKRKRRKGAGMQQKDCANCHTRVTPEWRRGPSGQRDLCNSCGLRWAKLNGRVSPRASSAQSKHSGDAASDKASKASASPRGTFGKIDSAAQLGHISSDTPKAANAGQAGAGEPLESPKQRHGEGHSAQMEGAEGVPERIVEDVEPD